MPLTPSRSVLITGASSGIGAALARNLATKGASVALVARRENVLREVAAECGERAIPIVADVTDREAFRRAINEGIARLGGLDVLVNNAGRGMTRVPSELTDDDIDDMVRINVKSALYGMQEILPHFKSRNTGHIINVSSMLGRVPNKTFRAAYSGAKHFLNALTANFREEVQATHPNVLFTIISPGLVATEFGVNAKYGGPDSRTAPSPQDVDEAAAVIANVIENPRPDVYTRPGSHSYVVKYFDSIGADP